MKILTSAIGLIVLAFTSFILITGSPFQIATNLVENNGHLNYKNIGQEAYAADDDGGGDDGGGDSGDDGGGDDGGGDSGDDGGGDGVSADAGEERDSDSSDGQSEDSSSMEKVLMMAVVVEVLMNLHPHQKIFNLIYKPYSIHIKNQHQTYNPHQERLTQ